MPIPRTRGTGRNKWFHDDKHSKEFQRRRLALDELIEELVERHASEKLTWRLRTSLEWEIRWLIGIRSAYVGPSDWLKAPRPVPATESAKLTELQVVWRTQASPPAHPCPVCDGTGDSRQVTWRARGGQDPSANQIERVAICLWELRALLKSEEGNELAAQAEDAIVRKFPGQAHLVRRP